jgi:hypothetical protein
MMRSGSPAACASIVVMTVASLDGEYWFQLSSMLFLLKRWQNERAVDYTTQEKNAYVLAYLPFPYKILV